MSVERKSVCQKLPHLMDTKVIENFCWLYWNKPWLRKFLTFPKKHKENLVQALWLVFELFGRFQSL